MVCDFKQYFSIFKQHYIYFHTLFHSHEFSKNTNNVTKTTLPNGPKFLSCLVRREKYDDFFCDTQAFSSLTLCLVGWILGGMENIKRKMG